MTFIKSIARVRKGTIRKTITAKRFKEAFTSVTLAEFSHHVYCTELVIITELLRCLSRLKLFKSLKRDEFSTVTDVFSYSSSTNSLIVLYAKFSTGFGTTASYDSTGISSSVFKRLSAEPYEIYALGSSP